MQTILLTGASSGLGLELAKLFDSKGYTVVALGRTKPALAIPHVVLDLTSGESIQRCVETIRDKYSDFSCLLHCAGSGKVEPLDAMKFDEITTIFQLDTIGPMALTAGLFDLIKKNEADIISVVATIGMKGYQYMTAYSSAKRGQRGFVENLQVELKGTKSRVIGVYPGGMETISNTGPQGRATKLAAITGKQSFGNLIDPKEVAQIIFDAFSSPKNIEITELVINRK